MRKNKNNKGYTMVELLAVIVILGILAIISITAVQGIIAKAKERYYKSQEENMVMAMQSYLNNNNKERPKISGQAKVIKLQQLLNAKYIDKVVDYKKATCSGTDSYVKAFKYEDDIYYTAYLKCPNYETKLDTFTSNIDLNASFTNMINNLKNSKVTFTINDNNGGDSNVPQGIISYQYRIYKDNKLVYTSDIFNTKRINSISKTIGLFEYTPGKIKLVVSATNVLGITKTQSFTEQSQDNNPPTCGTIKGDSTDWSEGTRTVTVACSDGNGSGCKRDSYTYEFTGDVKVGYIKIEDKAGRSSNCPVNVYIDNNPPVIEVKMYKKKAGSDEKENNTVIGSIKTSNTKRVQNVKATKGLYKNEWLNKANYPNGVFLELNYDDISSTTSIEWKWNDVSTKKSDPIIMNTKRKITPTNKNGNGTYTVTEDGYRQGQVIATDQFGHQSIINITIPLDRTAPNYTTTGESSSYMKGTRNISLTCNDTVSGCVNISEKYSYSGTTLTDKKTIYDNAGNSKLLTLNIYTDNTAPTCGNITGEGNASSWTRFNRTISVECKDSNSKCKSNKVSQTFTKSTTTSKIKIEDNVGNYRECPVSVYLDKDKPVLNYTLDKIDDYGNYFAGYPSGEWTKYSIRRNFYPNDTGGSGIKKTYWSGDGVNWNEEGNMKNWIMSSSGVNNAYYKTVDQAGNESEVVHLVLQVDKEPPSCNGSNGSTDWKKGDRTVTVWCGDNHSGCSSSTFSRYWGSDQTLRTGYIEISDGVGNKRNCEVNVYLDNEAPQLEINDGPKKMACGGKPGVYVKYTAKDGYSGLKEVKDYWGWDDTLDFSNKLAPRADVKVGSNSYTKEHKWSENCKTKNVPAAGKCYKIKVRIEDIAGNVTEKMSDGCSKRGN